MLIHIDKLDLSLQTRAGTDTDTVNDYAEKMKDGEEFPPVDVFTNDGETFWLADGFHRVMAARQMGRECVQANVHEGREDDAVVFGGTANNKQGKRPTRADVRHFLEMAWERKEGIFGGTPTGGFFAQKCGVSKQTGISFVQEMLGKYPPAPVRSSVKVGHLEAEPSSVKVGHLEAEPKTPPLPMRLIGANGKTYPVRPVRLSMPTRPSARAHVVPVDRYGVEIPVPVQAAFGEDLLSDVIASISAARCALRRGFEDRAAQFAAVRQEALVQLDNAYRFVAAAKPHCVCRMCQGQGCRACHGRGWQTEDEYGRNPREFRAEP